MDHLDEFSTWSGLGLGSVIGASILVYITVQVLAQIEFIPILGDWALRLISEIEKAVNPSLTTVNQNVKRKLRYPFPTGTFTFG